MRTTFQNRGHMTVDYYHYVPEKICAHLRVAFSVADVVTVCRNVLVCVSSHGLLERE